MIAAVRGNADLEPLMQTAVALIDVDRSPGEDDTALKLARLRILVRNFFDSRNDLGQSGLDACADCRNNRRIGRKRLVRRPDTGRASNAPGRLPLEEKVTLAVVHDIAEWSKHDRDRGQGFTVSGRAHPEEMLHAPEPGPLRDEAKRSVDGKPPVP